MTEITERSRGGGVLMALHNSIKFVALDTSLLRSMIPLVDIVICKCMFQYEKVTIVLLYIPLDLSISVFELTFDLLNILLVNMKIIIDGDFNVRQFYASTQSNFNHRDPKFDTTMSFCNLLIFNNLTLI